MSGQATQPDDGGPAFPNAKLVEVRCPETGKHQDTYVVPVGGMSLRDFFAAKFAAQLAGSDYTIPAWERTDFVEDPNGQWIWPASAEVPTWMPRPAFGENGTPQLKPINTEDYRLARYAYRMADEMLKARGGER